MGWLPTVAAVTAVMAGATGCGSVVDRPREDAVGAPTATPTPTTDLALTRASARIADWATDSYADSFAGVWIRDDPPSLVLYRRPAAGFDAAARQRAGGVAMEFRDAKHSLRELRTVAAGVMGDREQWSQRGVKVISATPLVDGSAVEIAIFNYSSDKQNLLDAQYRGRVRVVGGDPIVPPLRFVSPSASPNR
ncbi:hypothetical protein [Pilimelia anulata]|uniref:hypothetical protein n=1 Tax=Pilimelia anulata TaxID=53371 RepID=UPI00166461BA|nr:hypothetical protein [Pilimelia anulata]